MNLNKVDLNLFIVFDAIYTEANLTRAGQIVGITQPAVSNALSRLRETFNDPLFVRTARAWCRPRWRRTSSARCATRCSCCGFRCRRAAASIRSRRTRPTASA